jgi:DMSO/TMAO reductase YedYZ molybdopterin-dependent catalytic subunit
MLTKKYVPEVLNYIRSYDVTVKQIPIEIATQTTPFEVFDRGVFTPNDQFYVRWHWAAIPNAVDVETFRLTVRGHVDKTLSLSLKDIVNGLPQVELAAVNQCSGNSRGYFLPRVPGGQWSHGAMATPNGWASG